MNDFHGSTLTPQKGCSLLCFNGGPVATCLDVIERRLSVIERALGILVPGAQTKFGEVLPARAASTAASILLVSDIDGTLTGCDAGIKHFKQAWVSKFAGRPGCPPARA